jgi:hypothetical protein
MGDLAATAELRRSACASPAAPYALALADPLTAINLYLAAALRACDTRSISSELRDILEKTAIQAARARSVILQLRGEKTMAPSRSGGAS